MFSFLIEYSLITYVFHLIRKYINVWNVKENTFLMTDSANVSLLKFNLNVLQTQQFFLNFFLALKIINKIQIYGGKWKYNSHIY